MAKKYKTNKERCLGCGTCVALCPEGAEMEEDGKAKVIDSERLEECGGKEVCPYGAIEEISEDK